MHLCTYASIARDARIPAIKPVTRCLFPELVQRHRDCRSIDRTPGLNHIDVSAETSTQCAISCIWRLHDTAVNPLPLRSAVSDRRPDTVLTETQLLQWLQVRTTCGEETGEARREAFRNILSPPQRAVFDANVSRALGTQP